MNGVLDGYFRALGLTNLRTGVDDLHALQAAHMRALPFETIDPYLGVTPDLAPEAIARKMLSHGRGGYCFEHNTLLAEALRTLGLAPRAVLARVYTPQGTTGARTHLALVVTVAGKHWLLDAGFGGHGPLTPLSLDTGAQQPAPNGLYRIEQHDRVTTVLRHRGDAWIPLYAFDDAPVAPIDIAAANHLCATWDQTPFPHTLMIAAHTKTGRITLVNRRIATGLPPELTERQIETRDDLQRVLRDAVGLTLSADLVDRLWIRLSGQTPG